MAGIVEHEIEDRATKIGEMLLFSGNQALDDRSKESKNRRL